jgi:hypothetical protein
MDHRATFAFILTCIITAVLQAEEVRPCLVLTGRDSSVSTPEYHRVMTKRAWKTLWDRHTSEHPKIHARFPLTQCPEVDFKRYMIIAVFLGIMPNTEGIKVLEMAEQDEVVLGFDTLCYQSRGQADDGKPYCFILLSRSPKAIVLQFDTRNLLERVENKAPKWKERHKFLKLEAPLDELHLDESVKISGPEASQYRFHMNWLQDNYKNILLSESGGFMLLPQSLPTEHAQWLRDRYNEAKTVKKGHTYQDLRRQFKLDGGISPTDERRFCLIRCPFLKVRVVFETQERSHIELSNDLKIKRLYGPYLQHPYGD